VVCPLAMVREMVDAMKDIHSDNDTNDDSDPNA
jgi:hypothetical protein